MLILVYRVVMVMIQNHIHNGQIHKGTYCVILFNVLLLLLQRFFTFLINSSLLPSPSLFVSALLFVVVLYRFRPNLYLSNTNNRKDEAENKNHLAVYSFAMVLSSVAVTTVDSRFCCFPLHRRIEKHLKFENSSVYARLATCMPVHGIRI